MGSNGTAPGARAYPFFLGALIFLTITGAGVVWWGFGVGFRLGLLCGLNVALLTLCGFDKSASRGTSLRVPESVLLLGALLGGSAGLLLGMQIFRHKTRKPRLHLAVGLILVGQVLLYRLVAGDG